MHIVSISGFAEVDKLFGRAAEIHPRRFHPDRALHRRPDGARRQRPAALQDAEGIRRRRQETAERDHLQLVGTLRRAASADGAVHARRPASSCAICRPTAADRRSPPCSATMRRCWSPRSRPRNAQMKAGKLRALACFGGKRAPALPDVPTMKELGYDVEFYLWVGLFAPKGTPDQCHHLSGATRREEGGGHRAVQEGDDQSRPGRRLSRPARIQDFWDADAKRVEDAVRSDRQGRGMSSRSDSLISDAGSAMTHPRRPCRRGRLHRPRHCSSSPSAAICRSAALSSPGAGMLPKLMAGLMIALRPADHAARARASAPLADDRLERLARTPLLIVGITAVAIALYRTLGFLITMSLLRVRAAVVVERRNLAAGRAPIASRSRCSPIGCSASR